MSDLELWLNSMKVHDELKRRLIDSIVDDFLGFYVKFDDDITYDVSDSLDRAFVINRLLKMIDSESSYYDALNSIKKIKK